MKSLIVLLACAGLAMGQTSPAKALENTIIGMRDQMPCGFPDMGLPPMAPLKIDFLDLYHELSVIKLYGDISNGAVTGLNGFDLRDVTLSVLTLRAGLGLKFDNLNIKGAVNFQSWLISFLKIKSSGNLDMTLKGLQINLGIRFGMIDGTMRLMEFNPNIELDSIEFKSTGFTLLALTMKAVNKIAETVIMNLFTENKDALIETVQNLIIPTIDNALKDMTVADLLKMLTEQKEPGPPCIPPTA